ncbi:MAG: hypothetical protein K6F88_07495 [Ruminococcus sp.]|nr:hypothetical protein [Ruminococcus sp.]
MKRICALAAAVLILVFAAVPAFAADKNPSPTKPTVYHVVIHNPNGGTGTYTMEFDEDGQHATLVAHPKNGYDFVGWKIEGEYTLVSGKMTDKEIVILLRSDVDVYPMFKKSDAGSSSHISRNSSTVSPKTSNNDNSAFFFIVFSVLFVIVAGALGFKIAAGRK